MISITSTVIALAVTSGFIGEYDMTEIIPFYQDTTDYTLSITQDEDSVYYHLDWIDEWGSQTHEIGFLFEDIMGVYDFENHGLGVYKLDSNGLVGVRMYTVEMKYLKVSSKNCAPIEPSWADLHGIWNLETIKGTPREKTKLFIFYMPNGKYFLGSDFLDSKGTAGGWDWGFVVDDILVIGFQRDETVMLRIFGIKGDTLEGRWIEGYYDYENGRTVIESEGTERAVKTEVIENKLW
jgi:hypothetical protein